MCGGYLYVLHVREFLRSGEPVYKVGRTENLARRLGQYPKGSRLIAAVAVVDAVAAEQELLCRACVIGQIRVDYGREYIQCDLGRLLQVFWEVVQAPAYTVCGAASELFPETEDMMEVDGGDADPAVRRGRGRKRAHVKN